MEDFGKMAQKLIETKDVTDLFKMYINAMNNYNYKKPSTLDDLLGISR